MRSEERGASLSHLCRHSQALLTFCMLVSGCVAVGTGTRTVIKATSNSKAARALLPQFVESEDATPEQRIAIFADNVEPSGAWLWRSRARRFREFEDYLESKYGVREPETAALTAEVRDLGRVPVFSPTFQSTMSGVIWPEIIKIMSDGSLTQDQKLARKNLLLAQLLNAPESIEIKTLNRIEEKGCELYYYYPHLQVDLSADVLSPSPSDRFSELLLLVRLSNADVEKSVRFVNFLPKAGDIVDYTRGTFREQSQAEAKATYGLAKTGKTTLTPSSDKSVETTVSPSLGGELSYTYTEGFERDLKDAIERRTLGVVENGRTFLADLRSIRNVRIGGPYSFDLQLEIPSSIGKEEAFCVSNPVSDKVTAEILVLGVVRHVEEVGRTGYLTRVPEAENDDVFEQVVLRDAPDSPIWSLNGLVAARPMRVTTLNVVTNLEDARFVVTDADDKTFQESGGGKQTTIQLDTGKRRRIEVRFLSVVRATGDGKSLVLRPNPERSTFTIEPGQAGIQVIGEYAPSAK